MNLTIQNQILLTLHVRQYEMPCALAPYHTNSIFIILLMLFYNCISIVPILKAPSANKHLPLRHIFTTIWAISNAIFVYR